MLINQNIEFKTIWGRGNNKIISGFEEASLPQPLFEQVGNGMQITLFKKEVKHSDTLNDTLNIDQREKKLLELIALNSSIKLTELAKILNVSIETIKRDLASMQDENILKRTGSKKTGYWQIIKKIS
jgi:ATP-dependent DNA helicase RecG